MTATKSKKSAPELISQVNCHLMMNDPWYGHIVMAMTWKRDDDNVPTMGVAIVDGEFKCYYNTDFVESMSWEQLYGVVMHEVEHLVRLHPTRGGCADDHHLFNVACDMCVNGRRNSPRIGYRKHGKLILPKDPDNAVWIPKDWDENLTAEEYYKKLHQKANNQSKNGDGNDDGDDNGDGNGDGNGKMIDDHGTWQRTNTSKEIARELVREGVNNATKAAGTAPGHLLSVIEELQKNKVNWRSILKNFLGRHVGNRRNTWSRQNRRRQGFGNKGHSRHAAGKIQVVVDTSGSMGKKELEKAFAEIEAMAGHAVISLLQWDHAFQGFTPKYRVGDWRKIKVNGGGGTDMADPIYWLNDNGIAFDCVVMITDGYCNWAEEQPYPAIWVITERGQDGPSWGTTIHLGKDSDI